MEVNVFSLCNNSSPQFLPSHSIFLDSTALNSVHNVNFLQYSTDRRSIKFHVKLGFRTRRQFFFPVESMSKSESFGSSTVAEQEIEIKDSVNPLYVPTPENRDLRTPHSGYHFDGSTRKFFEGWYFKVSIPECRQSFCFMYAVENPAFRTKLNRFEEAQHGPRSTGVAAQILGADDKYICQSSDESQNFWGSRHELMLGNTFIAGKDMQSPNKEIPPQEFNQRVLEGFQVTPLWHQGSICDDGRSDFVEIVKTARWEYSTRPVYGWGNVGSKQKSTAGWLAAFPVFEPHWQICMAGGLSTENNDTNTWCSTCSNHFRSMNLLKGAKKGMQSCI